MNKISQPAYNDAAAFAQLAVNPRLGSYPHFTGLVGIITGGYQQYQAVAGNALHVLHVPMTEPQGDFLRAHYKNPPSCLEHIEQLRAASGLRACPMCGSLHTANLDHLLPKSSYPEFAVFSLNLVPACSCNEKRNDTLVGANVGERVLHPYFDNCLAQRLVKAHFQDLGPVPRVSVRICIEHGHPDYSAVAFHVESVLKRTRVESHLAGQWSRLYRKPSLIIRALDTQPETQEQLRRIIERELALLDESFESKNNWNSIFCAGLLDDHVIPWLFATLRAPERLHDGSLPY